MEMLSRSAAGRSQGSSLPSFPKNSARNFRRQQLERPFPEEIINSLRIHCTQHDEPASAPDSRETRESKQRKMLEIDQNRRNDQK